MYYTDNDFRLYHHGILGQKWGKKNGPPYPLNAGSHSSSEKKAGWRQSLKEKKERKSLYKDTKDLAKTSNKYSISLRNQMADRVEKNLTDEQRQRIRAASKKYDDDIRKYYDEFEPRQDEIDDLRSSIASKLANDEISRNPDAYKTQWDKLKAWQAYYDNDSEDMARKERPDLFKNEINLDKSFDEYTNDLRSVGSDILQEYSNKKVVDSQGYVTEAKDIVADALLEISWRESRGRLNVEHEKTTSKK